MENSGLDMSLDEDTSSMDEIAQKCPLKPQKKNKGEERPPSSLTLLEISALPLIRWFHSDLYPHIMTPLVLNHSAEASGGASLLPHLHPELAS